MKRWFAAALVIGGLWGANYARGGNIGFYLLVVAPAVLWTLASFFAIKAVKPVALLFASAFCGTFAGGFLLGSAGYRALTGAPARPLPLPEIQTQHDAKTVARINDLEQPNSTESSRWSTVFALGESRDPIAVPSLTAALKDDSNNVRQAAAFGLGEIKDPRAIGPLIDALKDPSLVVRQRAVSALRKFDDPRATQALKLVSKNDPDADGWLLAFKLECLSGSVPCGQGHSGTMSPTNYTWRDSSGRVFLASQSTGPVPGTIPEIADRGLIALPVSVKLPYPADANSRTATYQLYHKATIAFGKPTGPEVPADFLIGETHLGKSQIKVARVFNELLEKFDVDAVFVEQPDDLAYDWGKFKSLESDRLGAISALQHKMIDDASNDLAPFLPYYRNAKSDDEAEDEIVKHLGPSAKQRLRDAMATSDRYEKSEYLSATDYYYLALGLEGWRLPFHNIESRGLRDRFDAQSASAKSISDLCGEIAARDQYMKTKALEIIRKNSYRRIVWVIGAQHLQSDNCRRSLPDLLKDQRHSVTITYDSLKEDGAPGNKKKEMMILVKPSEVLRIAASGVEGNFQAKPEFIVPKTPSKELLDSLDAALGAPQLGISNPTERREAARSFAAEYSKQNARTQASWVVKFQLTAGSLVEVKRLSGSDYELTREWPAIIDANSTAGPNLAGFSELDPNGDRLRQVNSTHKYIRVLGVRDTGGKYLVYPGEKPYPFTADSVPELVLQLNKQIQSDSVGAVYLELHGFSDDKARAFESNCRIQQKEINSARVLGVLDGINSTSELWGGFLSKAHLDPGRPATTTEINTGPYKGFVQITLHLVAEFKNKIIHITLEIYAKTQDIANEFVARLRSALGKDEALTLADSVALVEIEMRKKYNLSEDELKIRIRKELGPSMSVQLLFPDGPNRGAPRVG